MTALHELYMKLVSHKQVETEVAAFKAKLTVEFTIADKMADQAINALHSKRDDKLMEAAAAAKRILEMNGPAMKHWRPLAEAILTLSEMSK